MADPAVSLDAHAPADMAELVQNVGMKKGRLDMPTMFALAVLAGAFIGLGADFATVVWADNGLSYSLSRLLGGLAFSLGLILVIVGGAELFTGNSLIVMAWAARKVSTGAVLRNWAVVYAGNFVGSILTAYGIYLTRQWSFDANHVGVMALNIAYAKVTLGFLPAFTLGIFCNALVCLAVWLCFSARSTTDRILAIVPPISAFVAGGFEHSIANMYFIPMGLLLRHEPGVVRVANKSAEQLAHLTWRSFFVDSLVPVTLGNVIGGGIMVAAMYWFVYLRHNREHRFVATLLRWKLMRNDEERSNPGR